MELSRRFFLGGAISLLAANTFVPSASASGNLPRIWGDGKHDDTSGLGALFRKEPVIFSSDKLGVDDFSNATFHWGKFRVTQTIELPHGLRDMLKVERMEIDATGLDDSLYVLRGNPHDLAPFVGLPTRFTRKTGVAMFFDPIEEEPEVSAYARKHGYHPGFDETYIG